MIPAALRHPIAHLRTRLTGWWLKRLSPVDRVQLTQRNVYILPTGAGWMLGATLTVLLVASINYQLNLGYLLTFLLAGCAGVAMHVAHGTLRGLSLHLQPPEPVFAGTLAHLSIHLHNPGRRPRYAIALALHGSVQSVFTNVGAQDSARVQLAHPVTRRGLQTLPAVRAQTLFPLGTFRVWTFWQPASHLLAYPQPERQPPAWLTDQGGTDEHAMAPSQASGDPDGVRPYRRGDTLKSIVWKKVAQTGELVSRDSLTHPQRELWLDLRLTGLSPLERQLSRLCAWALQAESLGLRYGLRLGAQEIAPDQGPAHLQRCLRALALA